VFKIYLFRHGRTEYNVKGLFCGHQHTRLVWRGKRDAKIVAQKLKSKKFGVAFHTSLPRSQETLNFVLKFHPECKKILVDDRMIERSYGDLEGTSHKDFMINMGKRAYDLRVEGDAIENLAPPLRKKVEKFLGEEAYKVIHRGYDVAARNGESFADVEKRVEKFIIYLKKFMKKNKVNVAISAHGNSIRLFRKIMEKASRDKAIKWFIPYDKVFEYSVKA
jgi:2,3-bisphosphoglycerate-dependent phosphoglycerate mutase